MYVSHIYTMAGVNTYNQKQVQGQGELELARNVWNLFEKVRSFNRFQSCSPGHLITDHVTDESGQDLKTETGEEDGEEHL